MKRRCFLGLLASTLSWFHIKPNPKKTTRIAETQMPRVSGYSTLLHNAKWIEISVAMDRARMTSFYQSAMPVDKNIQAK